MIEKIRFETSKWAFLVAVFLSPRPMRPILWNLVESYKGVPGQLENGRTGGLITSVWSVSPDGQRLGRAMEGAALEAATKVRTNWRAQ